MTRSTSCPSSTEATFSPRTRQCTVRNIKTRTSVPSAPPCTSRNFAPRNQPSLESHAISVETRSLVSSESPNRHLDSIPPLSGQQHTFIKHAPSLIINSITRALVMIFRESFQLSDSKQMCWSHLGNAPRLCRCGERSGQSVTTFTNEDELFTLVTRIGFSDASRLHCWNNQRSTTIVKFSHTLPPSMSFSRNPGSQSQLYELTPSTHVPRGPHVCIHTAIVNISTLVDGGDTHWLRSVFLTWSCFARRITCTTNNTLAERSLDTCSATMLKEFWSWGRHVSVQCSLRVSHPQPPDRSQHGCTVVFDRDPTVI